MDSVDVYEVLVQQHQSMLLAYVLGIVRDPTLAEDVVQEAFVIGYRKLAMLEKKEAFAAWLRTIARHVAFSQLKKRNREIPSDQGILEGLYRPVSPNIAGGAFYREPAWSVRSGRQRVGMVRRMVSQRDAHQRIRTEDALL